MGTATNNCPYQNEDYYAQARRSTELVNTLNDVRRQWVRLELSCNQLILHYKAQGDSERPIVANLDRMVATAKVRIRALDELTTEVLADHERIMQKILERD